MTPNSHSDKQWLYRKWIYQPSSAPPPPPLLRFGDDDDVDDFEVQKNRIQLYFIDVGIGVYTIKIHRG